MHGKCTAATESRHSIITTPRSCHSYFGPWTGLFPSTLPRTELSGCLILSQTPRYLSRLQFRQLRTFITILAAITDQVLFLLFGNFTKKSPGAQPGVKSLTRHDGSGYMFVYHTVEPNHLRHCTTRRGIITDLTFLMFNDLTNEISCGTFID